MCVLVCLCACVKSMLVYQHFVYTYLNLNSENETNVIISLLAAMQKAARVRVSLSYSNGRIRIILFSIQSLISHAFIKSTPELNDCVDSHPFVEYMYQYCLCQLRFICHFLTIATSFPGLSRVQCVYAL